MLVSGCSAGEAKTKTITPLVTPQQGRLTPYISPTATITSTPPDPSTATPLPSPTATPFTHTVKKGEDMSGIALQYGISLADLIAANPTVQPHFLSVGTVLVIPPSKTPSPPNKATAQPQGQSYTPTALPLELGKLSCARAQDGGVWCFQAVRNPQNAPIEGVTAIIHLTGASAKPIVSQPAFLPLDRLPGGAALPLAVYFSPEIAAPLSGPLQFSSEITAALPSPDDGRYLPGHTENEKVLLSPDRLSAEVSADIILEKPDTSAKRVWVAAVAYNAAGMVNGVRRWEYPGSQSIAAGKPLPVSVSVYSGSDEIQRVELVVEIRP